MDAERIVVTGPTAVRVEETTVAEDLGPTEILTETQYSLVSPGTEVMASQTLPEDAFPKGTGYASVGEVLAVGDEVTDHAPGDLVFTRTQHASHHRIDAATAPVVPVPDGVEPMHAPFARLCGVGMPAVQRAETKPPSLVGVFGLGLVGVLSGQVAAAFGHDVVGVDPIESRREAAAACGLDGAFEPGDGLADALAADAPRDTMDLVLECSGTVDALVDATGVATPGGEIVQVGAPWTDTNPDLRGYEVQDPLFHKHLTLRGGWEWQIPDERGEHGRYSHAENYAHALRLIGRGEVQVADLLTHVVTPAEVQRAYTGLAEEKAAYLGVVIDWTA